MMTLIKPALTLVMLSLIGFSSACAARKPSAERESQATTTSKASYRIRLVNQTSQPLRYRYTRYLPPDARREPFPQDPMADPQLAGSLNISLSFDELAPGAATLLEVIPGTNLILSYQRAGTEQRDERSLDAPMQLSVSEAGIASGELPPAYR